MEHEDDPNTDQRLVVASVRTDAGAVVVELAGELDLQGVERFRDAIGRMLEQPARSVRIDVTGVTFTDSAGLQALLSVRADALASGASFSLLGASGQMRRLVRIAGLEDLLLPSSTSSEPGAE